MVNIFLEGYRFDAPSLHGTLKSYVKPHYRVAVVALSFRDSRVRNVDDWDALYGKDGGSVYGGICSAFSAYGIGEESITFINYFTDTKESAAEKIRNADVIFFTGGLPDRMLERMNTLGITDVIRRHEKVAMGYSAGALIQLSEYHISPDHDYPEFAYYDGLSYIDGFYLEVHYEGMAEQNGSIARVVAERERPVYATSLMKGAIIVDNGRIITVGDVRLFNQKEKGEV